MSPLDGWNAAENTHFLVSSHGTRSINILRAEKLVDKKREQVPTHDCIASEKYRRLTQRAADKITKIQKNLTLIGRSTAEGSNQR
jgi:hypothetical protein